ncbi:cupin 2 conserved barrel domain protein [Calocera cornea HHB12733]|uniref:Cupin 2 conserved barrel domain protein n=1 Tax=Calocera cornea HHB12733 TaxID=1353952 RepID=A0A165G9F5_9BASI|nr:cupin 2 conserved barrel domain protein [Calocera cornea HHB12733]
MHHFSHIMATAEDSPDFRRVLWTGKHSQLVIMDIPVGGEIGEEIHHVDQTLCFTKGKAKAVIEGEEKDINSGDIVIVPAGNRHNFINIGSTNLILYTVYAPAEHADGAVHHTKAQADELEEEGKDEPPKWAQQK